MEAKIRGSSALTIASYSGRTDLVKLLLENCSDVKEQGVQGIDDGPEELDGTDLHLIEKGRKDILQILLDHGADVNMIDSMGGKGKTVLSGMNINGDVILLAIVIKNGGRWRSSYLASPGVSLPTASTSISSGRTSVLLIFTSKKSILYPYSMQKVQKHPFKPDKQIASMIEFARLRPGEGKKLASLLFWGPNQVGKR